jgi:hypothetical protein
MAWQPIDTAPEGVSVLVRGLNGVSLAERKGHEWFVTSENDWICVNEWGSGNLAQPTDPTEWHPVPD